MTAPTFAAGLGRVPDVWLRREHRAAQLLERHAYARDTLALYLRLLAVQRPAHARASAARIARDRIVEHVVDRVAPAVVAAVELAGVPLLAPAARRWLCDAAAHDVAGWLADDELSPVGTFFARASSAPVLEAVFAREALPERDPSDDTKGDTNGDTNDDPRRCPRCGGLPQLAFTPAGGDALVTSPLQLVCARCSGTWRGTRLSCAACGEADTAQLVSFAADEQLPHLRVDACHTCRRHLVHVDLRRDAAAVPEVDELLALPLDLHAQQQGFTKIVGNQMGI